MEAGADALGFIFYKRSPRFIEPSVVGEISRQLPPFIARAGVFVNMPEDEVRQTIAESGVNVLQFHGDEPAEFCARFSSWPVIKAFRIQNADSLQALTSFKTAAWLLDSYVAGQLGGTGESFNWDIAKQAVGMGCPVILAGGLTLGNVVDAIRQVEPYGLDVSSGVETSPGKKNPDKVRDFIRLARSC